MGIIQCDQNIELKVAQFPPKVAQKLVTAFYSRIVTLFKWLKKSQEIRATFEGVTAAKTFQK